MGRVIGWDRKALVSYKRCRTSKGNLLRWKKRLDPGLEDVTYRICGEAEETGAHVGLVCFENEGLGRRFGSWEPGARLAGNRLSVGVRRCKTRTGLR